MCEEQIDFGFSDQARSLRDTLSYTQADSEHQIWGCHSGRAPGTQMVNKDISNVIL